MKRQDAENDPSAEKRVSARRFTDEQPHQIGTDDRLQEQEQGDLGGGKVTGCELEEAERTRIDVTFVWDRIQEPRPDSTGAVPQQDDYRLNFALSYDFQPRPS